MRYQLIEHAAKLAAQRALLVGGQADHAQQGVSRFVEHRVDAAFFQQRRKQLSGLLKNQLQKTIRIFNCVDVRLEQKGLKAVAVSTEMMAAQLFQAGGRAAAAP